MTNLDSVGILESLLTQDDGKRFRRTTTPLIDREVAGEASGWTFCVPSAFDDALDLKATQVTEDKVASKQRTQDRKFHFKAGALLYDTSLAYTEVWTEALIHLRQMIRIERSTPVNEEGDRFAGSVTFSRLKPNAKRSAVEVVEQVECSQDDFVRFLITGELASR